MDKFQRGLAKLEETDGDTDINVLQKMSSSGIAVSNHEITQPNYKLWGIDGHTAIHKQTKVDTIILNTLGQAIDLENYQFYSGLLPRVGAGVDPSFVVTFYKKRWKA